MEKEILVLRDQVNQLDASLVLSHKRMDYLQEQIDKYYKRFWIAAGIGSFTGVFGYNLLKWIFG